METEGDAPPAFALQSMPIERTLGEEFQQKHLDLIRRQWSQRRPNVSLKEGRELLDALIDTVQVLDGQDTEVNSYPRMYYYDLMLSVGPLKQVPGSRKVFLCAWIFSKENESGSCRMVVAERSFRDGNFRREFDQWGACEALFESLNISSQEEGDDENLDKFGFFLSLLPRYLLGM